jgi:hypothetical protein
MGWLGLPLGGAARRDPLPPVREPELPGRAEARYVRRVLDESRAFLDEDAASFDVLADDRARRFTIRARPVAGTKVRLAAARPRVRAGAEAGLGVGAWLGVKAGPCVGVAAGVGAAELRQRQRPPAQPACRAGGARPTCPRPRPQMTMARLDADVPVAPDELFRLLRTMEGKRIIDPFPREEHSQPVKVGLPRAAQG